MSGAAGPDLASGGTKTNATATSDARPYRTKEYAMTTTPQTAVRSASPPAAPIVIFALLGLLDIGLLGVVGSSIAPPLGVSILFAVLGLVTLVALIPARRGSRPALITAVTARIISAVLALGAFVAGAPVWIMVTEGSLIIATIIAIVMLRRPSRSSSPRS
jgi:hypothetical protein